MCTILTVNTFSGNAAMPQRDSKRWVQSNKCLHPANGKVSISAGLHKGPCLLHIASTLRRNETMLSLCLVCFLLVLLFFFLLPWKLEIYAHAPCLLALISLYITCTS
jgi:hypothetical protein